MQVQLATRLDARLRQRLRIYAAVTGRTVADVVSTALDGYLPPAEDMVRNVGGAGESTALAEHPGLA
jgi:predicted DNA-binding protein